MTKITIKKHSSISDIGKTTWNKFSTGHYPFVQFEFLHALENNGCVDINQQGDSGWKACHIAFWRDNMLIGMMPGYEKEHSYGEYVFDHAWANAYHQHGLTYYPKWISAIPFTPVTGTRLMAQVHDEVLCLEALQTFSQNQLWSSHHYLFCAQNIQSTLSERGYLPRNSVQFQWYNRGFQTFDEFLQQFTSRKRKDIRKERRSVNSDISFERLTGEAITAPARHFFFKCYQQTYLKRSGHPGYLNSGFFEDVFDAMAENILLVMAKRGECYIASALLFFDDRGLYGRYWGAVEEVKGLHFECCYYQGIEFAIENDIPVFNPGTQGEHKLLRGFEPTLCHSSHLLKHPDFHQAVKHFLNDERLAISNYYQQAESALPFNQQWLNNQNNKT